MANAGKQTAYSFFGSAMANRLAQVPGAGNLATYGNGSDGATSAAAYNSRVLASQTNGAGPTTAPTKAPFSFVAFATGQKDITTKGSTTNVAGGRRFKR